MKKYAYIWLLIITCCSIVSCQQEDVKDPYGYLSINVTKNTSVITKTSFGEENDRFLASLFIIKDGTTDTVYKTNDYTAMEQQRLLAGRYRVVVKSYTVEQNGFDADTYAGETTIDLLAQSNQTAKIVCTLADVKAAVFFSDKIKDNFISYKAYLTDGYTKVTFDENETRSAYFIPGSLHLTVDLINKNGTEFTDIQVKDITNTKARQYYNLKIDIDDSGNINSNQGGGNFTIEVNESTNTIDCYFQIILTNNPRPTISLDQVELTLNEDKILVGDVLLAEGVSSPLQAKVKASYPISRLALQCEFFTQIGLPEYIELSTAESSVISQLNSLGIVISSPLIGETEATVDLTALTPKLPSLGVANQNHLFKLIVRDSQSQENELNLTLTVQPNGTANTQPANAWAHFAYLNGSCYAESRPHFLFKYRELGQLDWTVIEESELIITETSTANYTFTTQLKNLSSNTTYEYMACTNASDGEIIEFTTESENQIPNSNFDKWCTSGKSVYPNQDLNGNFWWDSGNEGANTVSTNNPTSEEKTIVVSGSACKMKSIAVFGNFAAGNVYTGDFGKATLSPVGATLSFGRPFTTRPSHLTGYIKYTPGTVNYGSHVLKSGDTDECYVYILLTNWSSPFNVNTGNNVFIDFNDASIIGKGTFSSNKVLSGSEANGYMKFDIPITYTDLTTKASYVVVVATASRYGDYFTGSTSSVLYLDELSLIYDQE